MSVASDKMVPITFIQLMHGGLLPVHRDYDSAMVGAWRLDLDGIGQLQVALDKVVEGIRDYQERQAAERDSHGPGSPEWEARSRELRAEGWTQEADARDHYRDQQARNA